MKKERKKKFFLLLLYLFKLPEDLLVLDRYRAVKNGKHGAYMIDV